MKDIMGMMKAASEMKGKMEAMQAELAELVVEGRAGGRYALLRFTQITMSGICVMHGCSGFCVK
jgi:DNA-binding protein YbaB